MIELWLVRHGQTDWNLEKRYQGYTDVPLNAGGLAQAAELADMLAGTPFDAIYTSDLQRARQTAEIVSKVVDAPVYEDAALRESNFGEWEGRLYYEMKEKYPALWQEQKQNPCIPAGPGGETLQQVAQRMTAAVSRMAARFPGGRVLVVSHGISLAVLVCSQQSKPLNEAYSMMIDHGGYEILHWKPANQGGAA